MGTYENVCKLGEKWGETVAHPAWRKGKLNIFVLLFNVSIISVILDEELCQRWHDLGVQKLGICISETQCRRVRRCAHDIQHLSHARSSKTIKQKKFAKHESALHSNSKVTSEQR